MKKILLAATFALASVGAQAADAKAAATTVIKAFSCELPAYKVPSTIKALKTLGAKRGEVEGEYFLPSPMNVLGFPVSHFFLSESNGEGPETYIAQFSNVTLEDISKAANLKPINEDRDHFYRKTKTGHLSAAMHNGKEVKLICAI